MSLPQEGSRDVYDGIIVSMVPDICLTPAGGGMVPVPYTIWCSQADAANLANSVRQTDDRSHAVASIVVHCYGDEPGTGGGIHSGTTGAECTPKTWSQTVRAEGRNMVRHNDQWWMNHRNTYGRLIYLKDLNYYNTPKPAQISPQIMPIRASSINSVTGTPQLAQQPQSLSSFLFPPTNEEIPELQREVTYGQRYPSWDEPLADEKEHNYDGWFNSTGVNEKTDELHRQQQVRITARKECRSLAKDQEGEKYKGGSDNYMTKPAGDELDSHHMPSDAASPISRGDGPAIQMDEADHDRTASQSTQPNYLNFIQGEKDMVNQGNFLGAMQKGIDDVRGKFGNKYDSAIEQMSAYARCLKSKGAIR